MQPIVSSGTPAQRVPGRSSWGWAAVLAVNLGIAAWLLFSQARLNRRLDRLEAAAPMNNANLTRLSSTLDVGERPSIGGRPERIAMLLAAASDPESSRRILESLPPGRRIEIARTLIARPAANDRNTALGTLLQKIADEDPAQAVTLLDTVPEAGLKNNLAAGIATSWIEHDPAAASAWLAGAGASLLAHETLNHYLVTAVTRWSAFDPPAATRFFATRPIENDPEAQVLRAVSREWARKDPAAALAWAQSLPPSDPRKSPATYGVLEGWSELNPTQAAGYVGQLTYGPNQRYAGEAAAVAAYWTPSNPAAAAQWALGLPDRRARRDALQQVAATWAASDTPSAARWASALPASGDRAEIWRGIGDFWAGSDPTGVEIWLSTLPVGSDRDEVVAAYAAKIVPSDPAKALTWAKTLSDGAFAAQQIQTLFAIWLRRDAPAARNWAAANGISSVAAGAAR